MNVYVLFQEPCNTYGSFRGVFLSLEEAKAAARPEHYAVWVKHSMSHILERNSIQFAEIREWTLHSDNPLVNMALAAADHDGPERDALRDALKC